MVFIDCDYGQAELRVLAAETRDPFLLNVYATGGNMHDGVLEAMYGPKDSMDHLLYKTRKIIVKGFNFGWAYGAGLGTLVAALQGDVEQAKFFLKKYEDSMPVAARWRQTAPVEAKARGYIESRTGRRRRVTDLVKVTEIINQPIQGGASDCTIFSGVRLDNEGYRLLLLVHDSTVTEVPERDAPHMQEYIRDVMIEEAVQLYPEVVWDAEADISDRWLEVPGADELKDWMEAI